jgi:MoxR-like ATPase
MQERQISVDGKTCALERPFLVIATQNPSSSKDVSSSGGTARPLHGPLGMGYPSAEAEADLLLLNARREEENALPSPVMSREEFLRVQDAVEQVHMDDDLRDYMVRLVRATREDRRIRLGASPRGTLALFPPVQSESAPQGKRVRPPPTM